MWLWWTKINQNPSIFGRLSVIKWRNWTWWEGHLNTEISDATLIAVAVWPQWISFGEKIPIFDLEWLGPILDLKNAEVC